MTFVLVNPQDINVSNPVTEETIMSNQEKINDDYFPHRKYMEYLVGTYATQGWNKQLHTLCVWLN